MTFRLNHRRLLSGSNDYAKNQHLFRADLETVKSYLMTPALLNYVVAGLIKFHPIEPDFSFRQN